MRVSEIFLFATTAVIADVNSAPLDHENAPRLIQTSELEAPNWLTEAEVLRLIQKRQKFVDVTEDTWNSIDFPKKSFSTEFPTKPTHESLVWPMIKSISSGRMMKFLEQFTAFHTRYYKSESGAQAANWLLAMIEEIVQNYRNASANVSILKYEHPWPQFSVVVRLDPPVDQTLLLVQDSSRDQLLTANFQKGNLEPIVILGSHIDSINQWNPWFGRAPGADDDGSGTSALVEVLRLLLMHNFVPKRPIELHFYSAEEGGLLGSQKIATAYVKSQIPVFSMYQIDMTGFVPPNKSPIIGVATDNGSPALVKVIKMLVKTYCSITAADVQCGYGCSDHYSWFKMGVDAIFTFEATFRDHSPYIHTSGDTLDKIDVGHSAEFAKAMLAYAVEMSKA